MNKSILVLTMSQQQSNYEVTRLVTEAEKMGIEVNRCLYKDLSFEMENGSYKVLAKGKEINKENTIAVWFRVAGTVSGKYVEARNLAIRLLQKDIFCTNSFSYLHWPRMGKISQYGLFVENEIPIVPTKIYYTKEQIQNPSVLQTSPLDKGEKFTDWELPVIAKHERGYQGKSVRKFDTVEQVRKWVNKKDEKVLGLYMWQKCLPTKWDLRIIVLGGKVIGAMKRTAAGDEFRSNFSLGGEVDVWNLSEKDKEIAEKVAKVCGLDYCGVDIMKGPKNPFVFQASPLKEGEKFREEDYDSYVLEVNRQCQFQGFEKSTEINVAKKVVEMLLEKQ